MILDQVGIVVCGATAIMLANSKVEARRRCACLFGAAAQPFWFWTTARHAQWGILAISVIYAFSWFKGVWQWWIQPRWVLRRAARAQRKVIRAFR